jgi:hypothetical protein
MRLAVVTMVYNEVDYMDLWCRHYGAQVGAAHCFVVDHGSDDGTTEGLDPVNVIRIPRSPQDDAWRAGMISRLCAELLKSYDVVIYVDVDEFLVADPRYHRNLIDCARAMTGPVMTAIGLEVWHLADSQPAIDITRPISLQRDWVWFNSGLCKAAMIREAVDWSPGFHSTASPVAFDHLFLFHLRYFDVERGLRRLARTRAMPWAFDYSGRHQRVTDEGWLGILRRTATRPKSTVTDLDARREPLASLLRDVVDSQVGREAETYKIKLDVISEALLPLPARFRGRF